MTKHALEWISAGLSFVAAIAWMISAYQKLPDPEKISTKLHLNVSSGGTPYLARQLGKQSRWSAIAAVAAALAAIAQGSSLLISN